jgi:cytochrome c
LVALPAAGWAAIDEEDALELAKKSNCLKCHSVDVKKEGPAYREVAKKYRGKPDAEKTLYTHVTTAPKVKIDGEEEDHQIVKSKKKDQILNLLRWILSQ